MAKSKAEPQQNKFQNFMNELKDMNATELLHSYIEAKTGDESNVDELHVDITQGFELLQEWLDNRK